MPEVALESVIVGTRFKGSPAIAAVSEMLAGDEVTLKREPNNRADSRAVACHFQNTHVGYLPRSANQLRVSQALDLGIFVEAIVREPAIVGGGRIVAEPKLTVRWHEP